MTPNEILRDFRTKYLSTFVWVSLPSGKSCLARIDAVNEDRDRQAVIQLSSNEYGKLVLNFASAHELKFRFPTVGTFQYGKDSLIMYRRAPHRQYQRGLGEANHTVLTCTHIFISDILSPPQMDLPVVEAAFKAEKYRAKEALPLLVQGKVRSAALDGLFSMSQSLDANDRFMMFMGTTCIGRVDESLKFTAHRGSEVYTEEVQQVLTEI